MFRSLLISSLLVACTGAAQSPLHKPDGTWHLTCAEMMDRCVKQAEDLCKGRGYVVLSGMSKRTMYGAELGVSQVEKRESELDVACADRRGDLPTVINGAPVAAPSASAPVAPASAPVQPAAPPPAASPAPSPVATSPMAPPSAPPPPSPAPTNPAQTAPAQANPPQGAPGQARSPSATPASPR